SLAGIFSEATVAIFINFGNHFLTYAHWNKSEILKVCQIPAFYTIGEQLPSNVENFVIGYMCGTSICAVISVRFFGKLSRTHLLDDKLIGFFTMHHNCVLLDVPFCRQYTSIVSDDVISTKGLGQTPKQKARASQRFFFHDRDVSNLNCNQLIFFRSTFVTDTSAKSVLGILIKTLLDFTNNNFDTDVLLVMSISSTCGNDMSCGSVFMTINKRADWKRKLEQQQA
ncbi:hypothetical protein C0J52_17992, partial [Blattella germanica]